jgi:hypothetical protein
MRRTHILQVLFFLVGVSIPVSAELITYRFVDGAAGDQAEHTLTGTITMDPSCGSTCGLDSIDSWEYTVMGPLGTRSVSSIPTGEILLNAEGVFTATPSALTFNYAAAVTGATVLDLNGLVWDIDPQGSSYHHHEDSTIWWNSTPTSGNITIATAIPEPTAALYLGLVTAGYAICRRKQR